MSALAVPRRKTGRPSPAGAALYSLEVQAFCAALLEFRSALPFPPSARGWCYVLEGYGLQKGDFDAAEALINDCRKSGDLPLDICSADSKRAFENLEHLDLLGVTAEAASIVDTVKWLPSRYTPVSFWDDQEHYLQMLAEKGDIRQLYTPICAEFHVPIASAGGWGDLNVRAELMARFRDWERRGKRCVLLYIGDFDPGGLRISDKLRSNLEDLADAVGWHPENLIIDRFGLDYEFIEREGLTWIDNLITGSGGDLADPRHRDHTLAYVQGYLRRFGARKVESNALLNARHVEAGRDLCRQAILKYLSADAPARYLQRLRPLRQQVRDGVLKLLREEFGSGATP